MKTTSAPSLRLWCVFSMQSCRRSVMVWANDSTEAVLKVRENCAAYARLSGVMAIPA